VSSHSLLLSIESIQSYSTAGTRVCTSGSIRDRHHSCRSTTTPQVTTRHPQATPCSATICGHLRCCA
jgi:hypothetical protein